MYGYDYQNINIECATAILHECFSRADQPVMAKSHSIRSLQNLSPLNDDGSHVYTLCPPSIIMSPMDPHYVPLNDDGSRGSLQSVPPQLL